MKKCKIKDLTKYKFIKLILAILITILLTILIIGFLLLSKFIADGIFLFIIFILFVAIVYNILWS